MSKPTIKRGVASRYAVPGENIYDVGDGRSGALIRVYRNPSDDSAPLVIEVYRADSDVLVRTSFANLDADAAGVMLRPTPTDWPPAGHGSHP